LRQHRGRDLVGPVIEGKAYDPGGMMLAGFLLARVVRQLRVSPPEQRASLRRVFSPRSLDALQYGKTEEHNCAHHNPMRGEMEQHGSINQPADQYQEADKVNSK
jgi:hypothetical protein